MMEVGLGTMPGVTKENSGRRYHEPAIDYGLDFTNISRYEYNESKVMIT